MMTENVTLSVTECAIEKAQLAAGCWVVLNA